MVKPTLVAF